ncbi:antibiotic biosynthesis monooxygenase [Sphingopyxis sp.]|uniref:antibiotic biosynthesis monooxygenase family protein n=1 Tax=Sphingopyxis sp. TaxID=1908224 RepID=UPI001DDA8CF1|nr:antibiotic biosynthesis monooxygenase [Sphingopyxis sp.]MBW8294444.1 antibiotic biosynthesis monooxygenase [Sphingopyxis sp.]
MIAVLFEVWPAEGKTRHYLDLAAALKEELIQLDGFVSIERFESLSEPGKLLSLSFFRDEEAVAQWRNSAWHRATQSKGRGGVFSDYRLRVTHVLRDYGLTDRAQAPDDSRAAHG